MEPLDISKIKTKDDLDKINFSDYITKSCKNWIDNIKYPVSQKDLDYVCRLSDGKLANSMGELFIKS